MPSDLFHKFYIKKDGDKFALYCKGTRVLIKFHDTYSILRLSMQSFEADRMSDPDGEVSLWYVPEEIVEQY